VHSAAFPAHGEQGRAGGVHLIDVEPDELVDAETDCEEEGEDCAVTRAK